MNNKEIAARIREHVIGYLEAGNTHEQAAHYALADEIVRLDLRMRALARATLKATFRALPRGLVVPGHVELEAIAEGKDLP